MVKTLQIGDLSPSITYTKAGSCWSVGLMIDHAFETRSGWKATVKMGFVEFFICFRAWERARWPGSSSESCLFHLVMMNIGGSSGPCCWWSPGCSDPRLWWCWDWRSQTILRWYTNSQIGFGCSEVYSTWHCCFAGCLKTVMVRHSCYTLCRLPDWQPDSVAIDCLGSQDL